MLTEKEKYRSLCEKESIPLFMQAWWMDAVCIKGTWEVFLYEKNGKILGAMPFHVRKKLGLKFIIQPQLTQYSGIWINYPENASLHKKMSLEKEICFYFIDKLKKFGFVYYNQNFHHSFTNWQPFYWQGFKQTTRYSYVIENISDPEKVFSNFSDRKKRDIRKAQQDGIVVRQETDLGKLYAYLSHCHGQRKKRTIYPETILHQIGSLSINRQQGMIFSAYNNDNKPLAALFVVWDSQSTYALLYSFDLQHKNSGASSLLFWEAIKYVSDKTVCFDFEGSMIQTVAESYGQFSDKTVAYFNICKSNFRKPF